MEIKRQMDKATLKKMTDLKRKYAQWRKKYVNHPEKHICYSVVWCEGDDLRSAANKIFSEWFSGGQTGS